MREIKFRAWDRMSNHQKGVMLGWQKIRGYNISVLLEDPDIDLMQFTGLKDKNGKEIYEGDIIRYEFLKGEWAEQPVTYFGAGFSVAGFPLNNIGGDGTKIQVEVIGNIYENPELINPTK